MAGFAGGLVQGVVLKSQVTPDFAWAPSQDGGEAAAPGGLMGAVMRLVRPAAYLQTAAGLVPIEPYGPPEANYAPLLAAGAVVLAGAAVVGLGQIARGLFR